MGFVQADTDTSSSGTTLTFSLGASPTAGNVLVIIAVSDANLSAWNSPSDGTWNELVDASFGSEPTFGRWAIYWKEATGSEDTTITVQKAGGSAVIAGSFVELDNVDGSSLSASSTSGSGTDSTAECPEIVQDEINACCFASTSAPKINSVDQSYTLRGSNITNLSCSWAEREGGSTAPTFDLNATTNWASASLSWAEGGGAQILRLREIGY